MMVNAHNRTPSLDDAYGRVRRAKNRLAQFKRQRTQFFKTDSATLVGSVNLRGWIDEQTGDGHIMMNFDDRTMPEIMSFLVGETLYHMRAALDHLIYELSVKDYAPKQIEKHIPQFPIESTPEGWKRSKNGRLRYLSAGHKTAIKRLQPLYGCQWTGQLQSLSNPDKHRHLTVTNLGAHLRYVSSIYNADTVSTDDKMEVQPQITRYLTFDDGLPVIETLQKLISDVTNVLNSFNSEF